MIFKQGYFGYVLGAIALIGFAVIQFYVGTIVLGRPPIAQEATLPLKVTTYLCSQFVVVSALFMVRRQINYLLIVIGFFVLVWSGSQNLIRFVSTFDIGLSLTNLNKALSWGFGLIFMGWAHHREKETEWTGLMSRIDNVISFFARSAKYIIGIFLLTSGVQHFLYVDFVVHLIPAWIPFPIFWVCFTGTALIGSGLSFISGIYRKTAMALTVLMVFSWVFLVHVPLVVQANSINEWTSLCEATMLCGILLLMYVSE